jgi:transcriptional regulator with GAF, ATPase, and Fis domain
VTRTGYAQLIGQSPALIALKQEIQRVAQSDAKILITGESGVGKELVAMSVHAQSLRSERPFITVNCAGLPETLLESELFGHVKGSFTGAYRDKPGMLEKADEGTIFLDEIGEMSLRMQGMLLRFLETGELQKVGADRIGRRIDVRVIAATNRALADMVAQGQFREDLYYRLNVINIHVPPLRERREDIPRWSTTSSERAQQLAAPCPGRCLTSARAATSATGERDRALTVSGCGPVAQTMCPSSTDAKASVSA